MKTGWTFDKDRRLWVKPVGSIAYIELDWADVGPRTGCVQFVDRSNSQTLCSMRIMAPDIEAAKEKAENRVTDWLIPRISALSKILDELKSSKH